jgi:hypothetical protein
MFVGNGVAAIQHRGKKKTDYWGERERIRSLTRQARTVQAHPLQRVGLVNGICFALLLEINAIVDATSTCSSCNPPLSQKGRTT